MKLRIVLSYKFSIPTVIFFFENYLFPTIYPLTSNPTVLLKKTNNENYPKTATNNKNSILTSKIGDNCAQLQDKTELKQLA